jgi:hypothetical protein
MDLFDNTANSAPTGAAEGGAESLRPDQAEKSQPALESAFEAPGAEQSPKDRAAPEAQVAAPASIPAVPEQPTYGQAAQWAVEQAALAKLGISAPVSSSSKPEPDENMRDGAGGTGNRASSVWSTEEDDSLRSAVQVHSSRNWKAIAAAVPSKTSIQCLHRWRKVLDPQLVKGAWTAKEDNMIRELVGQNGPRKW